MVERTIENTGGGAFFLTHGSGGYASLPIPPDASAGMFTFFDIGQMLDSVNEQTGPGGFNDLEQEAADYAANIFCWLWG